MNTPTPKQEKKGCSYLLMIVFICFLGAGIFFYAGGLVLGAEYRHILFFAFLFTAGIGLFIKELFFGKHW